MNAVAEEAHKHRSTDGVTVIKILLGVISALIMSFMGIITYVYNTNSDEWNTGITNLVGEVRLIREQGITLYSHVENNDAKISRLDEESRDFRKETREYWGRP